jgi:hypothetical protein
MTASRTRLLGATLALLALPTAATAQCQLAKIIASNGAAGDLYGEAVAIDGDRAVVGAPFEGSLGPNTGAAYVYERSGDDWLETAILSASDAALFSGFGTAVDIEGDTLVVGAPSRDGVNPFSGAIYVFDYDQPSGTWNETAKLVASDGQGFDEFGESVSISGASLVVGATGVDLIGNNSGAAYVYRNTGGVWSEKQKIAPSNGLDNDAFGVSVSMDGSTLMVGANQTAAGGAVYVFDRIGSTWTQVQQLAPAGLAALDQFGEDVSLSGTTAIIGSPATADAGVNTGSAYVFDYDGSTWNETVKLLASDATTRTKFGTSVGLDGTVAVVGAPGDFAIFGLGGNQGKAYTFALVGASWTETGGMQALDKGADDFFGSHVDVSGNRAIFSAPRNDDSGTESGSAYFFKADTGVALFGCTEAISLAAGGVQNLKLNPPASFAMRPYFLIGSASGSSPGIPFSGFTIPLNPDAYLLFTVNSPNTPPLGNSFGTLSGAATANATFTLGAGTDPSLAGLTVSHAFAVLDPTFTSLLFVSNAETVELVP